MIINYFFKKKLSNLINYKFDNLSLRNLLFLSIYFITIFPTNWHAYGSIDSKNKLENSNIIKNFIKYRDKKISDVKWSLIENNKIDKKESIKWEIVPDFKDKKKYSTNNKSKKEKLLSLSSLNRSIVFNNKVIGPDISWLVPPGFKWNQKYRHDVSVRGHNRRENGESLLGWNGGDAVGQFLYQPFNSEKYSFGFNYGIRSVYKGEAAGGGTEIGEGSSLGFRLDKKLSDSSGIAFGGEQILHFDGLTDTGRDFYLTISKGWWSNNIEGQFPLTVGTIGFGTGKLAEGNIKGLCSDLFGGSGTEIKNQRRLCWSPIFSIARVHNPKLSSIFEYNSKWFLLGASIAPFKEIAARGTFAVQISDHIDNYKVNNFNELKWVFRLSLGL